MIDITTIDWDNLKLAKSGRVIKLIYNKDPLEFCTSVLYTPFGVKSVIKNWSNFTDYNIDVSINELQGAIFKSFIETLDERMKNLIVSNNDLFKDQIDINNYNCILKENKTYPKLIRLQLPRDKNGNFESIIFDEFKNKIKIDDSNISSILSKGKSFKCIIECSKIWNYENRIGSIWSIKQLKFEKSYLSSQNTQSQNTQSDNYMMIDE